MDFKPLQRNLQVYTVEPPRATTFGRRIPSQITENVLSQSLILEPLVKDNNGNFICVFECTIVNLATYRQFTNAAWDWIIKKKKKKQKQNKTKAKNKKISKLH